MLNYSGISSSGDNSQFESRISVLEDDINSLNFRVSSLENSSSENILKATESINKMGSLTTTSYTINLSKGSSNYSKIILKIPEASMNDTSLSAQEIALAKNSSASVPGLFIVTSSSPQIYYCNCIGTATIFGSLSQLNKFQYVVATDSSFSMLIFSQLYFSPSHENNQYDYFSFYFTIEYY